MPKKFNLDIATAYFNSKNLELLEDVYISSSTKMKYKCKVCNYESYKSLNKIISMNTGCQRCAGNLKYSSEEVENIFRTSSWETDKGSYSTLDGKLLCICKICNTEHYKTLRSILNNTRCSTCKSKAKSVLQNDKKPYHPKRTLINAKGIFKKLGLTLNERQYKNASTKMPYTCEECCYLGYKRLNDAGSGYGCPSCAGNLKYTFTQAKDAFTSKNLVLLDTFYTNSGTKMKYQCNTCGYIGSKPLASIIISNSGCQKCSGLLKNTLGEVTAVYDSLNLDLLELEYKNSKCPMLYKCRTCSYEGRKCFASAKRGQGCKVCGVLKNCGEGNPSWRGGKSFEPYCVIWRDTSYKDSIKERDNYICQNPSCLNRSYEDLNIHHIDYDKKNCNINNLITVCRSCNGRANFDREWHTKWYRTLMTKRFGYYYV